MREMDLLAHLRTTVARAVLAVLLLVSPWASMAGNTCARGGNVSINALLCFQALSF